MNTEITNSYSIESNFDFICFSHLNWDLLPHRSQNLLTGFAEKYRVFFIEEPIFTNFESDLDVSQKDKGIHIVVPHIPYDSKCQNIQKCLLGKLFVDYQIEDYIFWYFSVMMLDWSKHLHPLIIVYNRIDELSAFKNIPFRLIEHECELFSIADLVYAGGNNLFQAINKNRVKTEESLTNEESSIDNENNDHKPAIFNLIEQELQVRRSQGKPFI